MNNSNIFGTGKLSREELSEIRNADILKKRAFHMGYGLKSLFKNPVKAIIALIYLAATIIAWLLREALISHIPMPDIVFFHTMIYWSVTILLPALGLILFLGMLIIFGRKFCTKKVEHAFISAGIYTKTGKYPWLFDKYKDKAEPIYIVLKVYLNGNIKADFEAKRANIESELGIKIHKIEEAGTQIILLYTTPGNKKGRNVNRADMHF